MSDVSASAALLAALITTIRTSPRVLAAHEGGRTVNAWQVSPTRAPGLEDSTGYPLIEIPSIQELGGERLGGDPDDDDEAVEGDDGADTVVDPIEMIADIHVYSRIRADGVGGAPEAMNIAEAVRRVTARALALDGPFKVTLGERSTVRHFTDPDGATAHSIVTSRYLIHPSED